MRPRSSVETLRWSCTSHVAGPAWPPPSLFSCVRQAQHSGRAAVPYVSAAHDDEQGSRHSLPEEIVVEEEADPTDNTGRACRRVREDEARQNAEWQQDYRGQGCPHGEHRPRHVPFLRIFASEKPSATMALGSVDKGKQKTNKTRDDRALHALLGHTDLCWR